MKVKKQASLKIESKFEALALACISGAFSLLIVMAFLNEFNWVKAGGNSIGFIYSMGLGFVLFLQLLIVLLLLWSRKFWHGAAAVILFVGATLVLRSTDNFTADRDADFTRFLTDRNAVVAEILTENSETEPYKPIPVSKDVAADEQAFLNTVDGNRYVIFPILMFGIDNFSCFVYSEAGITPPPTTYLETVHTEKLEGNWYWIRTT